jgi:hypothetical protein
MIKRERQDDKNRSFESNDILINDTVTAKSPVHQEVVETTKDSSNDSNY